MPGTINDIFRIDTLQHTEGQIEAALNINPESPIFEGHFPGQPVVPGACMVQLVNDVLEDVLSSKLLLKKAGAIKFSSMLIPGNSAKQQLSVSYKIIEQELTVSSKIIAGDVTCFKFQAIYTLT